MCFSHKNNSSIGFSLKEKLLIIIFFVTGLPILFFSLRAQTIVQEEIYSTSKAGIESESSLMISEIQLWQLRNESEILRITDANSMLTKTFSDFRENNSEENKKAVLNILDNTLFNTPTFLELVIMDHLSGEILISTSPASERKIGIREDALLPPAEKKRSSPVFFSNRLGSHTLTVEKPLKNETGTTLGVVGVYINLQSLRPLFLSGISTNHENEVYLVNPDGQAIIRENMVLKNDRIQDFISIEPGIFEYVNHEQKEVMGYHEYLADLNVIYIYEHEKAVLFSGLNELTRKIILIGVVLFMTSLFLAYFLVDRFTRPVKKLTLTAQKIAEGNYNLRSTLKSSDEIGILAKAFNSMANSLTTSLQTLSVKNALLESQSDASFYGQLSIDKMGKIISWNENFKETWKISEEMMKKEDSESLLKHCAKMVKDPEGFIKKTGELFLLKKIISHDIIEMKDGKFIDRQSAPLLNEKKAILGRIFFCRDITKEIEVNKTKNEFVSLATHQLQTPLTAVRWLLENLSDSLKKDKDETKLQLVKDASDSTERVIQLVSDMLNVSRLDSEQIVVNSKKTDLVEFLEKQIEEAAVPARQKNIEIIFKKPSKKIEISFDTDLVSEVILNLLSNSIRFSDPNKKINVQVKKEKESVSISVKDQGIGISKKDQKELFTKFFRTSQASRYNTTGSGLGLYVIKKILDTCKGRIVINSIEGKGSTFTVHLPLKGPIQIKEGAKILIHKGISI